MMEVFFCLSVIEETGATRQEGKMKALIFYCFFACALMTSGPSILFARVPAGQDTIFIPGGALSTLDTIKIPGGTLAGRENKGSLEATINGDTTSTGARVNPNRVYALNEGQYYFQVAPINVYNPAGTLTIAGIPSGYGKTKPVILIANTGNAHVVINQNLGTSATNQVYGSLKFENIHYVTKELDGYQNSELFFCGTIKDRPQKLTIDNCLFEFSNIDLFDCTNEQGAIGGWPYGAKFFITSSYFRNMFEPLQWWSSRVFQCKHPIDTLWVENCTVTGGGPIFLQQNELTDFAYFTHNTFVNIKKNWLLSPYYRTLFIVNNIFINQNWVGEDTNVTSGGQNPVKMFTSTINVDSVSAQDGVVVQGKYYVGDSSHYSHELDLTKLRIFVSDNINYYDPLLVNGYYASSTYVDSALGALPSYLTWSFFTPPFPVRNVPGEWMNSRTQALFDAYGPGNGGFVERRTETSDPGTVTKGIADASVVTMMAEWNQNQWGDPRFPTAPDIVHSKYIFGDYDPTTLPGIANGVKTDTMTTGAAGITKFTDLTENFHQPGHLSAIDGFPIGSLIWDDAALANYNPAAAMLAVLLSYLADGYPIIGVKPEPGAAAVYSLAQNYPNPFNPSTTIRYGIPMRSNVSLIVYNTLGQRVTTLVNEPQDAGYHEVKFDGSALASGVYFYRLRAGTYVDTKRLLLLR
jgi:hypothetical protein